VQYALQHQPDVNKALMDERIVNAEVKSRLADWYPQLNFDYTLQHYFKIPVSHYKRNACCNSTDKFFNHILFCNPEYF
jgi:outer membrane protein TolC